MVQLEIFGVILISMMAEQQITTFSAHLIAQKA